MSCVVAEKPSKKPEVEERSGRKTAPIQVAKDLAKMVGVISQFDGINQNELIEPLIRPFLEVEYDRVQKAIQREIARKRQA